MTVVKGELGDTRPDYNRDRDMEQQTIGLICGCPETQNGHSRSNKRVQLRPERQRESKEKGELLTDVQQTLTKIYQSIIIIISH